MVVVIRAPPAMAVYSFVNSVETNCEVIESEQ